MSSIFGFFFVIIAIYVAIGLFTRARRGWRQGGRMGVRDPGYDPSQGSSAYGYDSNGNPIQPGFGPPGPGSHHGHGGHHGGFGGGHGGGGHGGGGFGGHGGGDAGGGGGGGHH